jgi:hypothetical protein
MNSPSAPLAKNISFWFFITTCVMIAVGTLVPAPLSGLVPLSALIFFALAFHQIKFSTQHGILFLLLCSLLGLGFLSSLNAVDPDQSLSRSVKLIPLLLINFLLIPAVTHIHLERRYFGVLAAIGLVTGCILTYELASHLQLYAWLTHTQDHKTLSLPIISKSVAVFVLLVPFFIAASILSKRYIFIGLFLGLCCGIFYWSDNQATKLSLIIMTLATIGSLPFLQIITIRTVFISIACVFVLMPWIAPILYDGVKLPAHSNDSVLWQASVPQRLEIWDFIARRVMEDPVTGFGVDATRSITDFDSTTTYFPTNHILHPHNTPLQLWIEFGVFGIICGLGFLWLCYHALMRLNVKDRTVPFITFCGVMVFLMVSWSLWSSWLIAVLFLLTALMSCLHRVVPESSNAPATA